MLSKDAVSGIFNTTRRRIHWLSWMNLGIAGLGGVLAYRPELRGVIKCDYDPPSVSRTDTPTIRISGAMRVGSRLRVDFIASQFEYHEIND